MTFYSTLVMSHESSEGTPLLTHNVFWFVTYGLMAIVFICFRLHELSLMHSLALR